MHWAVKLGFIAVFLFTVFTILKQLIPEQSTLKIRNFLSRHSTVVLIVSSLLFGMVHINNYVDTFVLNAALIALIIPRIISGFMMGLLKIKNENIVWPMALHAMNNGFVIIILIISRTTTS